MANFTANPFTIAVSASPGAGGTVSGGGSFPSGSSQTVTATANPGYTFANWTEGGSVVSPSASYNFTLTGNRTLVANFSQMGTLTVVANPANGGTVGGGGSYPVGSQQTITATANPGWTFTGWNDSNAQSPRTVTVPAGGTSYTANFVNVARPPNDGFASRIVLSGLVVSTAGENTNASKETGEPNHAGATGGKSVWWAWTAPASGTVTISTAGSSFDTVLGLYTGSSVSSLTEVVSNDDASGNTSTSLIVTNVVGGTAYAIAVDGYGGAFGRLALSISLAMSNTAPTLSAARTANQLVVSWRTNWDGYLLESAKTINPGATWDQVSPPPVVVGGYYVVSNIMSRPLLFYRLRHP